MRDVSHWGNLEYSVEFEWQCCFQRPANTETDAERRGRGGAISENSALRTLGSEMTNRLWKSIC